MSSEMGARPGLQLIRFDELQSRTLLDRGGSTRPAESNKQFSRIKSGSQEMMVFSSPRGPAVRQRMEVAGARINRPGTPPSCTAGRASTEDMDGPRVGNHQRRVPRLSSTQMVVENAAAVANRRERY